MEISHKLSNDDFAALAAAGGSPSAIAALRAGQRSKHTVMILAILDLAPTVCPEAKAVLEDSFNLLVTAQSAAPEVVESVLSHPHVGHWAARCLRRLRGTVSDDRVPLRADLGQLAAIAAVAAVRTGLSFSVTVPAFNGAVYLPTLGLASVGPADSWEPVKVSGEPGRVAVGPVAVPAEPETDGPGWHGLRRLRSDLDGVGIAIELDDLDPGRDPEDQVLAPRLAAAELAEWQRVLDEAWTVLVRQHRAQAVALAAGLVSIIPLVRGDGGNGASITARDAFGRFMLTPPGDGLSFGDTLIHEFHHSKLYAVMDLVPLHEASSDPIYYSPWRDDPRPLEGLLHGAYSYLAVTEYWRKQRGVLNGPERQLAEFEFARWRRQIDRAVAVMLGAGTLTAAGVAFVRLMGEKSATWQDLPVPAEPQRLADQAVTEHEIRWRLQNLHPDPAAVLTLSQAWHRGEPCPMEPSRVDTTVVAQPRKLRLSDRLALIRMRLAQPATFAAVCRNPARLAATGIRVTQADLAYVRDDFAAAYEGYLTLIAENPAPMEQWAGLVLAGRVAAPDATSGLAKAPELARAVYELVRGTYPGDRDLIALAGWLGSPRSTPAIDN